MAEKSMLVIASILIVSGMTMLSGCKVNHVEKPLRIALSKGSENYTNWVHRGDSLVEIVDMQGMQIDSALKLLTTCDGIVFTGGEDVVPAYYGKEYDTARCKSNALRDSLEFALIKESLKLKMPVFGICRGQQILNVALGGTLIIDIPTDHPGIVIHQCEDYLHCFHPVNIIKGSQLQLISKVDTGSVSSNHHQAIEKLAPGMRITAYSTDSIPEAMEWEFPTEKPFFIAVQWHPERMDVKSSLSMPLINAFLNAAAEFRKQK
jgi:putative glutamine amidotransferase